MDQEGIIAKPNLANVDETSISKGLHNTARV